MEGVSNLVLTDYVTVTLACLVIGYLITTTPSMRKKFAHKIPWIVAIVGAGLSLVLYGLTVEVAVYGALAGLFSTGLYEFFDKSIKNFGNTFSGNYSSSEDKKGEEETKGGVK